MLTFAIGLSEVLAQAYCTAACGETVCEEEGEQLCTSGAYDCSLDVYRCVDRCGTEYELWGWRNVCTYYAIDCPAGNGCCTTICDDPAASPVVGDGEDEGGDGGGDGGGSIAGGSISGQVKQDDDREAVLVGGVCQLAGASGVEPGAGSKVYVSTIGFDVAGDGTYNSGSITPGSYSVALNIGDPLAWVCTCPAGCTYGGVSDGTSGLDYYVSAQRVAWFQALGGNIHADGGNVTSNIPSTCIGACDPYLVTGTTSGLVSYTGSLDLGDFGEEGINETGDEWRAETDFKGIETDYGYFYRILSDEETSFGVFDGNDPGVSGVFEDDGSTSTIGAWSVTGGQKTVILVDNDILIDDDINVDSNSFLAILSSGSITIDDDVTNVEGVFVADNLINTCNTSSDLQLDAEGVFVGWGGVNLCRDFDSLLNNTFPAEVFVYRPDLQVNAYNYLMRPYYFWQEVAP